MTTFKKDRNKIISLLNKDEIDYNELLLLTNKLVKHDPKVARFTVDAGVINRLGKELVARHETAVAELVKNAYDADATEVDLEFHNTDKLGGTLKIIDDGTGMTRDQLLNGFMRISSTDKIHNPISPFFKRQRAGRKGIGRFATQRLGDKLTIITQTASAKKALKLVIDWKKFELDTDLLTIANTIEETNKEKDEGTTLIIDELSDIWTDAQIKRVYRYSAEILQPFPLSKKNKKNNSDPGFKANFWRANNSEKVIIADESSMFLNHALAEIEGYVDDNKQGFYTIESKRLGIDEFCRIGKKRDDDESPYNKLKNIHFKAYYFIYEPDLLPKQIFTMIRQAGSDYGGIKLYRNGFRVLPYGEKSDDWLGLDASFRKRVILSAHGNNNFFGFVELIEKHSEHFEELSSREGILKDEIFEELIDFVFRVLISGVQKVAEVRNRKKTAGQKNWQKKKKTSEKIREIAQKVADETIKKEDIKEKLDEVADEAEHYEKELIDENSLLKVLAGLGLTMAEFIHEIKNYIDPFGVSIKNLEDYYEDKRVKKIVDELQYNYNSFSTYTSYFDKIISRNVNREIQPIEVRDVVNDFIEVIDADLKRTGITLEETKYDGYDLYTVPMHPSEWASILFNLYTNSKKAIKRSKNSGKILIRAGKQKEVIYIEFSDDGVGINEKDKEKIFDAFYTTTSPPNHNAKYYEEIISTGLGLKIVKDIVLGYDGEIFVNIAPKGFKTCIRIEIPCATEKELKKYEL